MSRNIKNELQDNSPINFPATSDLRTLAMRLHLSGNLFDAQQIYRQICDISPVTSEDYLNIALAQKFLGNLPEASLVFEKGILLNPDSPDLYLSYGEFLNETERHEEALSIYEKASSIFESNCHINFEMASTCYRLRNFEKTRSLLSLALISYDVSVDYAIRIGNSFFEFRDFDKAQEAYEKAISIDKQSAIAHANRGAVLLETGKLEEALISINNAIEMDKVSAQNFYNRGLILSRLKRSDLAIHDFQRALDINPLFRKANYSAASAYMDLGELENAIKSLNNEIELNSEDTLCRSNLLFLKNCRADSTGESLKIEAINFEKSIKNIIEKNKKKLQRCPDSKKIRLGFVSADFYNHPVGYFLQGLLKNLDRQRFELYLFYNNNVIDDLTTQLKQYSSCLEIIYSKPIEAVIQQIENMKIDILIDLSGHTDKNCLPIFLFKPAKLQISWLGYCGTTGIQEIDYVLGDPYVTPENEEHHFVEKIWRLPETYWCFTPPQNNIIIQDLPVIDNKKITFGCFNNVSKLNDGVVRVWSKIIAAVPQSRMFLKAPQFIYGKTKESLCSQFAKCGIESSRLIMEPPDSRNDYLKSYNDVDIVLDPFPYPGGTTSIEGLWMGVPFITKKGDRFYSHNGETILHNIGLPEWIAADEDDYVRKAIEFSKDVDALAKLRKGLRDQILASPLFDAERFARNFEKAMFEIWEKHCSEEAQRQY
jgi:protein O-GlcNAc transferase